jgi:hypothetical protein
MVKQPGTKQTGKGLCNTGNPCYLNGTVQALNHTLAFGNWLSSDSKHGEKCEKIAAEHDKCIICKNDYSARNARKKHQPSRPSHFTRMNLSSLKEVN